MKTNHLPFASLYKGLRHRCSLMLHSVACILIAHAWRLFDTTALIIKKAWYATSGFCQSLASVLHR